MPGMLHGVVLRGFSDPGERASFLAHFGLGCPTCEEHFLNWAMLPHPLPVKPDDGPTAAEPTAAEPGALHDPPRRALLRRRADLRGGFTPRGRGAAGHLPFLRLALEEARHASLGLPRESAVACVRRAQADLRLLRRYLQHQGSPPGCPPAERLTFTLVALEALASEAVAAELQGHGEHLRAEQLRREAETTHLLSEVGLGLDHYLTGRGVRL